MGKGFAIGSAALTALALFVSYAEAVKLFETGIDLLNYKVIVGLFVGGMLPFFFSALTMDSVSKAAYKMIEELSDFTRTHLQWGRITLLCTVLGLVLLPVASEISRGAQRGSEQACWSKGLSQEMQRMASLEKLQKQQQ